MVSQMSKYVESIDISSVKGAKKCIFVYMWQVCGKKKLKILSNLELFNDPLFT